MSAIIQRQSVQGIEIGAGMGLAILVFAISMAFVGMNGYHMSNYLVSKLTTTETVFYVIWWWKAVGFGVAALEIPLGMSFITNYRLHGFWHIGVISQLILALLVATLAAGAGIGSQLADAETRTNQITAAETQLSSYENSANAARLDRDSRLLASRSIEDPYQREIAQLKIKQRYEQQMARIAQTTATSQAAKPLKIMEDGSTGQTAIFALLSIAASIGAFYLSCFHAVYIKQLVALIAFSLKSKANHEWESSAADFKTRQHELSPLNDKSHGILFKEKVPARQLPGQQSGPDNDAADSSNQGAESPSQDAARANEKVLVKCPHCRAVFSVKKVLMMPSAKNKKGLLRCGECDQTFSGVLNITDKKADALAASFPASGDTKLAGMDGGANPKTVTQNADLVSADRSNSSRESSINDTAGNSQNPEISEKFAGNSHGIRLDNQPLTGAENSAEIPQKFGRNSTEISGRANSQDLKAGNSQVSRQVDLSKVAKIDDAEEKLKALAETIDQLAMDPESDGLLFSPTRTFKELHLNYGRVQDVFKAKQAEGKISETKPYKITYREAA